MCVGQGPGAAGWRWGFLPGLSLAIVHLAEFHFSSPTVVLICINSPRGLAVPSHHSDFQWPLASWLVGTDATSLSQMRDQRWALQKAVERESCRAIVWCRVCSSPLQTRPSMILGTVSKRAKLWEGLPCDDSTHAFWVKFSWTGTWMCTNCPWAARIFFPFKSLEPPSHQPAWLWGDSGGLSLYNSFWTCPTR